MNTELAAGQIATAEIPSPTCNPIPSPPDPKPQLRLDSSVGKIVVLSEADQMALMTLEYTINDCIAQGWRSFIDIGLALIQIKAKELYCTDYASFEEYCLVKWDFKHSKASYLMAAAQLAQCLAQIPDVPKPERESPLRPLLQLKPQDAQRAWKLAAEKTGGRRITARAVKSAVQELKLSSSPRTGVNSQRSDRHERITSCFEELRKMLSQRAEYPAVVVKVEELRLLVESLFTKAGANS